MNAPVPARRATPSATRPHPVWGAVLGAVAFIAATSAAAQVVTLRYVVTDLGNLKGVAGGAHVQALGLNELGQVVGLSENAAGDTHAFRTGPNRTIRLGDDLGVLGGSYSAAYAINNNGQVAGDTDTAIPGPIVGGIQQPNQRHAFRLDPGGTMVDLGTFAINGGVNGFNNSGARGINDAGQVVGYATVPPDGCASVSHAFRTSPNQPIFYSPFPPYGDDLGTLVPPFSTTVPPMTFVNCRSSIAWGISSGGIAVGSAATRLASGIPDHPFRTAPFVYRIDISEFGWGQGTAFAVNDIGETVGDTQVVNTDFQFAPRHAFLSVGDITHKTIDIGTLGGVYSSASGINTRYPQNSQVVGSSSTTGDLALHGFLWTGNIVDGGTMIDLNTRIVASSGWEITGAQKINNKGQIIGTARRPGAPFVFYAVRLDPSDVACDVVIGMLSDPQYGLVDGQINSITDKLLSARTSIQQGLFKQAVNQLNAAIKAIQTQVSSGKMSGATANALIAAVNAVIGTVS